MGLKTSNDEYINEEVDFEKEFYYALDEIKKLTKKN